MPTFIPSHRMVISSRVLLLSVTSLFGVLFLFSSTAVSEGSNEELLFVGGAVGSQVVPVAFVTCIIREEFYKSLPGSGSVRSVRPYESQTYS